jgi:hypothetical protein
MTNQHLENLKSKKTLEDQDNQKNLMIDQKIKNDEIFKSSLKKFNMLHNIIAYAIINKQSFYIPQQDIASYIFAVLKVMKIDFSVTDKVYKDNSYDGNSDKYLSNYFTILSHDSTKESVKKYQKNLDNCGLNYNLLIDKINNLISQLDDDLDDFYYRQYHNYSFCEMNMPNLNKINIPIYNQIKNATFPENIGSNHLVYEKYKKKPKLKIKISEVLYWSVIISIIATFFYFKDYII